MSIVTFIVQPRKYYCFLTLTVLRKLQRRLNHLYSTTYQLHFNYSLSWKSQYQRKIEFFQIHEITHRLIAPGKRRLTHLLRVLASFESRRWYCSYTGSIELHSSTIIYQYNRINDSCQTVTSILQII